MSSPRPPQQARSRALLERVLTAAEELLSDAAEDGVTMATVAERAGVSVGALYRRFDRKEQLLNAVRVRILERFETDLASALRAPTPDLGTTIDIYVDSVVRNISRAGNVLRQHIAETRTELQPEDPALSALAAAQRLLLDAASGHVGEVRRSDPITALSLVARTVLGACVQRALAGSGSPDGLSWDRWRDEIADMTIGYLTRPTSA